MTTISKVAIVLLLFLLVPVLVGVVRYGYVALARMLREWRDYWDMQR